MAAPHNSQGLRQEGSNSPCTNRREARHLAGEPICTGTPAAGPPSIWAASDSLPESNPSRDAYGGGDGWVESRPGTGVLGQMPPTPIRKAANHVPSGNSPMGRDEASSDSWGEQEAGPALRTPLQRLKARTVGKHCTGSGLPLALCRGSPWRTLPDREYSLPHRCFPRTTTGLPPTSPAAPSHSLL